MKKRVSAKKVSFETVLKTSKVINVIWSGGYDSTLLLLEVINAMQQRDVKVEKLNAIAIDCFGPSKEKMIKERECRQKIRKFLLDKFNIEFNYVEMTIKSDFIFNNGEFLTNSWNAQRMMNIGDSINIGLCQPPMWISALSPLMPLSDDGAAFLFGYIKGDDLLSPCNKKRFDSMFKALCDFRNAGCENKIIQSLYSFPLEHMTKLQVYKKLKEKSPEIFDMCWTCENPILDKSTGIISRCNRCHTCINENITMNKLKKLNK